MADEIFTTAAPSGLIGALIGAVGLWGANRMMGRAAVQQALNDGFSKLARDLQEERTQLRKDLADERLRAEQERAALHGEITQLRRVVEGLKTLLRRNGIEVPDSGELAQEARQ